MNTDIMLQVALQYSTCSAGVWGLTEFIHRHRPQWPSDVLAVVLGPIVGVAAYAFGFLTAVPGSGWRGWAGAAFAGLICTVTAAVFATYVGSPILARLFPPKP